MKEQKNKNTIPAPRNACLHTEAANVSASQIRQTSRYNEEDLPAPDNNLFWEHASNPLSSKGN